MPTSLSIPLSLLTGFLLVLARVAGVFVFVPLPGVKNGPEMARVVLSLGITFALFPQWPAGRASAPAIGELLIWVLSEAALGVTIGLAVAFITEAFMVATQMLGLQAGYAYASTIDPTSQADSSVLVVFGQLAAGLLFFVLGLDREVMRVLARSLETFPPGTFLLSRAAAENIAALGTQMFSIGIRLAMPALALLILVDLALALLGRINAQLQLLTLAFPVKMLAGLMVLAWLAVLFPTVFRSSAGGALKALHQALGAP